MKELQSDIKNKKFKSVYLFTGDEKYLLRYYENLLKKTLIPAGAELWNVDVFDGKKAGVEAVVDAALTAPFMSEHRLVIMRDSALFTSGRKNDTEKMADYLPSLKNGSVVVFVESQTDKRNRLYKKVAEAGRVVEFKAQTENDLIKWICNMAGKRGCAISERNAVVLLRTVAGDMDLLEMEMDKLAAYKDAKGEIRAEDIDNICTKALDTRIFDLIGAVGNKNPQAALSIYSNLMLMKEYPTVVLSMLSKKFRQILQCKLMEGRSENEIAASLGLRGYAVKECIRQSRNFTKETLIDACNSCFETDYSIKTGRIAAQTAVEVFIMKYAS